mgnify:CR=1 FL=1
MDHTLALIGRIHQGDKEARDTLFSENMGLVYSVARRFWERGGNGGSFSNWKHRAFEGCRSFQS